MKYSIVIPTYNNKKLLKNTLESLNYQDGYGPLDYEVVIVDDGSTDHTDEYIGGINRNYSMKYFYLERCENSCRARTRNYGWKNAQGEVVVFIDSDIIVKRDFLSELNRCFSESKDILVIGNRLMLDEDVLFEDIGSGKVHGMYRFDRDKLCMLDYRHYLYEMSSYNANAIMCPWMQVYSCNMAIPKRWLEAVGGFDENFISWGLEDVELGYALYKAKLQIVINPKLDVLHQYHEERSDLIIKKDKLKGYEENIDYFLSKHPEALRMSRKYAHGMLKGELSVDKMLMEIPRETIELDYQDPEIDLSEFKQRILTVIDEQYKQEQLFRLVINDYREDTNLDIWIQLLKHELIPKYYPVSKRLNRKEVINYIRVEQERQRKKEYAV